MDISKLMDLIGLGDEKPEDLESAMEKQILPDIQNGKRALNRATAEGSKTPIDEELQAPTAELPDHVKFSKVGRCPSCGDLIISHTTQPCAWCDTPCHPDKDGFHLVHIALGSFQERHCFCCDDCYEAFRRMYPARVHRNCYERPCEDCSYCIKRYTEEADGFPGEAPAAPSKETVAPEKA